MADELVAHRFGPSFRPYIGPFPKYHQKCGGADFLPPIQPWISPRVVHHPATGRQADLQGPHRPFLGTPVPLGATLLGGVDDIGLDLGLDGSVLRHRLASGGGADEVQGVASSVQRPWGRSGVRIPAYAGKTG